MSRILSLLLVTVCELWKSVMNFNRKFRGGTTLVAHATFVPAYCTLGLELYICTVARGHYILTQCNKQDTHFQAAIFTIYMVTLTMPTHKIMKLKSILGKKQTFNSGSRGSARPRVLFSNSLFASKSGRNG